MQMANMKENEVWIEQDNLFPGIDTCSIHSSVKLSQGEASRKRPPLRVYDLMVSFPIRYCSFEKNDEVVWQHIPLFQLLIWGLAA